MSEELRETSDEMAGGAVSGTGMRLILAFGRRAREEREKRQDEAKMKPRASRGMRQESAKKACAACSDDSRAMVVF